MSEIDFITRHSVHIYELVTFPNTAVPRDACAGIVFYSMHKIGRNLKCQDGALLFLHTGLELRVSNSTLLFRRKHRIGVGQVPSVALP